MAIDNWRANSPESCIYKKTTTKEQTNKQTKNSIQMCVFERQFSTHLKQKLLNCKFTKLKLLYKKHEKENVWYIVQCTFRLARCALSHSPATYQNGMAYLWEVRFMAKKITETDENLGNLMHFACEWNHSSDSIDCGAIKATKRYKKSCETHLSFAKLSSASQEIFGIGNLLHRQQLVRRPIFWYLQNGLPSLARHTLSGRQRKPLNV